MSEDKARFHVKHNARVSRETSPPFICPCCGSSTYSNLFPIKDHSISYEHFYIAACASCGLRFTTPLPDDLGPYYASEEYVSHSKTKKGLINRLYHLAQQFNLRYKYKVVSRFKNNGPWLDYGSGAGDFLDYLSNRGQKITGVEIHEESLLTTRSRGHHVLSPEEYPVLPDKFAAITMWHVLEHIPEPQKLIKRHFDHLLPQGVLVIAVPNHESHDARTYGPFWAAYDVPRHLWHFKESDIKKLVTNQGFQYIKTLPLPLDAYYISLLSGKYQGKTFIFNILTGILSHFRAILGHRPHSSQIYVFQKMA